MKIRLLIIALFIGLSAYAQHQQKSPQEKYIEQFATLAVEEMYRSGVPASITLAQGLLESRYGLSELAVKGNNHFGIKCHNNWDGKRMYYDDDRKGECFRKYQTPEESFRDHSDFLRYRDRYSFLFDFRVTDYKSWAHGLKKAGYATDPAYPKKLINLIEEYKLYEYDRKGHELPATPSQIERDAQLSQTKKEQFSFSLSRPVYTRNGVPFVYAEEGDTYESLASMYDLFPREILRFNDRWSSDGLKPGDVVYLRSKKRKAARGLDKHVMEEGETLAEISQRYAIKLSRILASCVDKICP